jgi:hypothetical protein
MKVFITKYALTHGIDESDAFHVCNTISLNMISNGRYTCYHKPDWHLTESEAIERAEVMRAARIASLHKSIAKMEKLKFRRS